MPDYALMNQCLYEGKTAFNGWPGKRFSTAMLRLSAPASFKYSH